MKILVLIVVAMMAVGCGPSVIGSDSPGDPETVFEEFWQAYDRYYAHFEIKNVDWDDVYREYRPQVGPDTSDEELFSILGEMIAKLEDGHVYLVGQDRRALSNRELRTRRRDFDSAVVEQNYVGETVAPSAGNEFVYGRIGDNIGYLRLRTLSGGDGVGNNVRGWIEDVPDAVEVLAGTDGMIVDLRNNSGGRAFNARYVAGLFATDRRPFLITRSRNGPAHNDFSRPNRWYAEPHDEVSYDRPVVVLTNRRTFSAAEWLTLALRQFDHVVHMGTHTGGGLAMFLPRQLSNGWMHTVSVQDARGPDGRSYERVGVPPQQYLENGRGDIEDGRDLVLEEAVDFLEK